MTAPPRLSSIDALRGIAVLMVIARHAMIGARPIAEPLRSILSDGRFGVELFFVISAFTLFLSLSVRGPAEARPFRNFFARRFFRIAPLFWCAVVFYLAHDGLGPRYWLGDAPAVTLANIVATATFVNAWYPYWINAVVPVGWSVAVEMSFYVMVPFLFARIRSLRGALLFTALALSLAYALSLLGTRYVLISDPKLWGRFLRFWLPHQLPVFGLGFILFFIYPKLIRPMGDAGKRRAALLLGAVMAAAAVLMFTETRIFLVEFLYGVVFLGLAAALLLHPFAIFVNRFTVYLGKISYSAYLVHWGVQMAVTRRLRPLFQEGGASVSATLEFLVTVLVILGITIAISSLTHRFIESPFIHLGRRLLSRSEEKLHRRPAHL